MYAVMNAASWQVDRLGIVMAPDLADHREVEGVLNPAVARGPDGALYLLPRLVAAGNYSRIGIARVQFDRSGDPVGVERLGVALEPAVPYELNARTGGGVEDPRITYLEHWHQYVMTYTAYGSAGPRVAMAISRDLLRWRRLGLVHFAPYHGVDFDAQDNKDAVLFPEPVRAPDGRLALALIHRPTFKVVPPWDGRSLPAGVRGCPSMWISYAALEDTATGTSIVFDQHRLLAGPEQAWERTKVGAGTPPVRVPAGWLVFYHGVSGQIIEGVDQQRGVCYSAGALLLDAHDPRHVTYRSRERLLAPEVPAECDGIVPRVVFPTGADVREDGSVDLYYGMADCRIGVARVRLADHLTRAHGVAA
jgi:predicted GH43/DUF377 family glycosyl hydrolase